MMWLMLCLFGCDAQPDSSAPPKPTTEFTEPTSSTLGVTVLPTLRYDSDSVVLRDALEPVIEGAEVVGVGESVHQSGGYHRARARVIKSLIEDHGYRAVAVEAHWFDVLEYARPYTDHCEGTASGALMGLTFSVWASESSIDVLQTICSWNEEHPTDPVTLFGVDIQAPWRDSAYLNPILISLGEEDRVEDLKNCLGYGLELEPYAWPNLSEYTSDADACLLAVEEAAAMIRQRSGELTKEERVLSEIALRSTRQGHITYSTSQSWNPRDLGMAENLRQYRDFLGSPKTIWWAHNAHIVKSGELLTDTVYPLGWVNSGSHLERWFGDEYRAIGLVAYEVESVWDSPRVQVTKAEKGSLEWELKKLNLGDDLFVNVKEAVANDLIDAVTEFGQPAEGTGEVQSHYDGLVYLRWSEAMVFARLY